MSDNIKPCPFCGGEAELDTRLHYRDLRHGVVERAVSVYCRQCSAEITVCVPDVPDITGEQVIEMWNKRSDIRALPTQAT